MAIVRYSMDELAAMKSESNWDKVDAMTDEEINTGIAADPDTYELTEEDFKKMRPISEVHPGIVEAYKCTKGNQKAPVKDRINIRLNGEIVDFFKARGKGWQTEINDILQKYVASHHAA